MISELALSVASIWIGSLFVYSGSVKLLASTRLNIEAVDGYKVLPAGLARAVGITLPYAELTIGALILLTPYDGVAAAATVVLGTGFAVASGLVLTRGISTGCGCAGMASDRITPLTLLRALAIVV